MRLLLDGGRFAVCVDGDEDFVEEYGKEDEGTEWRWPVPLVPAVCASEWASVAFVRPRMPLRPAEFPKDIAVNSMLQACHMHMSYCYL